MDRTIGKGVQPREAGGFSVICAEKIIELLRAMGLPAEWSRLALGHVSRRTTAYGTPRDATGRDGGREVVNSSAYVSPSTTR